MPIRVHSWLNKNPCLSASVSSVPSVVKNPRPSSPRLTVSLARAYTRIGLAGVQREWPHSWQHLAAGPADIRPARELHPIFFGCYDWHSAVHTHWMLARLRRLYPRQPWAQRISAIFHAHFTPDHVAAELAYLQAPGRGGFERPYGWAWLLALAQELHASRDTAGRAWAATLQPLARHVALATRSWLPRQSLPVRHGVHSNTAFALGLMLDYARAVGDRPLREAIQQRALDWFARDAAAPAEWEPSGEDFLSPTLAVADLMRRVLTPRAFARWWRGYLLALPSALTQPAAPLDRADGKFVHLDGLNLSRAWMLHAIAVALPADAPGRADLLAAAQRHTTAGLAHVASGDYLGEHWLASFAVYLLTARV